MAKEFPPKLREKLKKHLRRVGYLNVTYKEAMESAHLGRGMWRCCKCQKVYPNRKDLHGDHIEPVDNTSTGFVDWNDYFERLFLGQIQPLCKSCHNEKSAVENEARRERKKSDWEEID